MVTYWVFFGDPHCTLFNNVEGIGSITLQVEGKGGGGKRRRWRREGRGERREEKL